MSDLALGLRLARRELRGGLKGFRVFLLCLLLGVTAIAGVGSLSRALLQGLENDSRAILGGDLELRLIQVDIEARARNWLAERSAAVSEIAELRTMLRLETADGNAEARRTLVELKAVDQHYPLYGSVETEPASAGGAPRDLLAKSGGNWGALAEPSLINRLGLEVGDRLRIGALTYELRGTLLSEPDRAARAFTLGPRLLVARASLTETGLEQPGSLIYYLYRIALAAGDEPAAWRAELNALFPKASWRIRDLEQAAANIVRFIDRLTLFLTLVGLTSLLVGGVGIANAVKSYLAEKSKTIATFKCLGAPARLVFLTYLFQILALGTLGILGGLFFGALVPFMVEPFVTAGINVTLAGGIYWSALAQAALFGILTILAFTLWPLARAQMVPPGRLFRDLVQPLEGLPPRWAFFAVGAAALGLVLLAVMTQGDRLFALGFVAGAIAALIAFRLAAAGIVRLAARLPRPRRPGFRLALTNIHRPGAQASSVVMSLGLGITVLVAIALIQGNLKSQVDETLPEEAPGFYFIDIQPDQVERFDAIVEEVAPGARLKRVPMLRGRITAVQGVSIEDLEIPEEIGWVFRGDRGLTWTRAPLEDARLATGGWWPEDYAGKPLVSLDEEVGRLMNLEPGDELTINVLGRDFDVEIANLRVIDWSNLTINFVMVFSPGFLEQAPQMQLATVKLDPLREDELERAVTDALPNVTAIRVKEALRAVSETLDKIATAVAATASVALMAGVLVLAGAIAAGHHRRIYDAVVLKVLGATRRTVGGAFLLEYGLIGLATSLIAALIGSIAGWVVVTQVMQAEFVFLPLAVAATALLALLLTLLLGFFGTWRALGQKAAPLLRNE